VVSRPVVSSEHQLADDTQAATPRLAPSSLSFHQSTLRAASDATQREIGFELSVMAWSGGSASEIGLGVKGEGGSSLGRRGVGSDAGEVIIGSIEVKRVKRVISVWV